MSWARYSRCCTLLGLGLGLGLGLIQACGPDCPSGFDGKLDQCVMAVPPVDPCAVLPATKTDASRNSVMSRIDGSSGNCFWMDQTEVTVDAYSQWLKAEPAPTDWEPTYCKWKKEPSDPISNPSLCKPALLESDQLPFDVDKPIRCVDFCDAERFCRWNGKHLCFDFQAIGSGGPRNTTHEWRLACSNDLMTAYPWGDSPDQSRCQTGQVENGCIDVQCGPVPVGRRGTCRSPAGVNDLIGNVAEWTYACNNFDPQQPACLVRGGGYADDQQPCDAERVIDDSSRLPDVGFRCCASLNATERAQVAAGSPVNGP